MIVYFFSFPPLKLWNFPLGVSPLGFEKVGVRQNEAALRTQTIFFFFHHPFHTHSPSVCRWSAERAFVEQPSAMEGVYKQGEEHTLSPFVTTEPESQRRTPPHKSRRCKIICAVCFAKYILSTRLHFIRHQRQIFIFYLCSQ